ncbi:DUF418 domain-containing protein [Corynebacterium lubricantis]|uniref:DUF418 domain-containing protein n=1 Tax=Corynebacterium lubricantis TaxID=541095 RepID=UPI00039B5276|nr:DUF418 domain-containing protein [Corynebacterium lubricantis]
MSSTESPVRRGTTSPCILAPDAARGLALLGIAAANMPTAWAGYENATGDLSLGGFRPGATVFQHFLDQLAMVFSGMFVHVRGLPMFATLLGFGVGLISVSLHRRNFPRSKARNILLRRYGILALFGLVHCVFIFYGDILLLYGLLAMIIIAMMGLSNRTLKWITAVLFAIGVIIGAMSFVYTVYFPEDTMASQVIINPDTYVDYMGMGALYAAGYVASVLYASFNLLPVMLVGFIFARSRVLHEPRKYLKTLGTWIAVGAVIVLFVGLPWGLSSAGFIDPEWAPIFYSLNSFLGYFTGPAILALASVLFIPAQEKFEQTQKVPWWLAAPVALGKRSMTGYLLQSIILFVLMLPFTLNLFVDAGAFVLQVVAFVVWIVLLALAYALEKLDQPGPFEWVHRRLSYGKDGLPAKMSPQGSLEAQPQ